jgi:TraM recognition site of TraD and TraG/Domain of unknown function (DUF4407)
MRQLEDAAGQIASFGVKLWTILQDWNQGKALYNERWETFAANAGILQFFGNNDLTTLEYVSRRLGKTRIEVARQGEVGPDQAQAGLSSPQLQHGVARPADARRSQSSVLAQRPAQKTTGHLGRVRSDDPATGGVFRRERAASRRVQRRVLMRPIGVDASSDDGAGGFALLALLFAEEPRSASMAMFHDAIRTQLEQDVRGKNRQIEEQYAERLREQRTLRFGTLEAEVQRLTTSAGEMTRVLDAARQLRATASQRAEAYQIETDRELKGAPGYKAGAGSKYREALTRKVAADSDLAKADSDIGVYEVRLTDAQKKLDKASADLRAAEVAFAGEAAQIDEERKSHLIPDRNDALMSYLALEEVYSDPRFGSAARHFSWLMMAVLMTFELSYVVVRAWFTHPSVYMAILIGDTKKRADRVAADYESSRDALRRTLGAPVLNGRAPLRFLPAPAPGVAAVGEAREVGARNSSCS